MPEKTAFRFVDLKNRTVSADLESVFPGWKPGDERLVILSPHDDDAILGAGHLILAAQAFGGSVHVVIYCNGCLGYSSIEQKNSIVETRRTETLAAYASVGVPADAIHRFWIDDLAVFGYLGWNLPDGTPGTCWRTVELLRKIGATRVLIPNGYREHVDHEAVSMTGVWDIPQVGDPIVAEIGFAEPVRSAMQYAVWGDFAPEDALLDGRDLSIRANTIVLCERKTADLLNSAIARWKSQEKIIAGLVRQREARRYSSYMMEAYVRFDPRPVLDYAFYARLLDSEFGGEI